MPRPSTSFAWGSYPAAMKIIRASRRAVEGLVRNGKVRTLDLPGSRIRLYLPDCDRLAAEFARAPAGHGGGGAS